MSPGGERWTVPNTEAGVAELRERPRLTPALVVLEATGGYERAAVAAMAAVLLPMVVANPRQVRDFADLLALFAERVHPTPRPLADEASVALDALLTRRRQLVGMLIAERNLINDN